MPWKERSVTYVSERTLKIMEPTIGLEPMTCRLRLSTLNVSGFPL
jgi:hypothetical protein